MGIAELAELIGMPREMAAKLRHEEGFEREKAALLTKEGFEGAANALHEALSPDPDGARILSVMLEAATMSEGKYRELGIPHEIYVDTMKAFSRFTEEYRAGYGSYGFSAWWWAGRQTSLKLFRLGALEYEMCEGEISLHIPTGADLGREAVTSSLCVARAFFRRYFSAYDGVPYVCFSWLLDPVLKEVLPRGSRILAFAERFSVTGRRDGEDYKRFVFGRDDLPLEALPEKTFLQRKLKERLRAGGTMGAAEGILVDFGETSPDCP